MKISIYEFSQPKLYKMFFDELFFLHYDLIYCTKVGFGHLIVVKKSNSFEVPI